MGQGICPIFKRPAGKFMGNNQVAGAKLVVVMQEEVNATAGLGKSNWKKEG
jgi:hypothetical protein